MILILLNSDYFAKGHVRNIKRVWNNASPFIFVGVPYLCSPMYNENSFWLSSFKRNTYSLKI